MSARRNARGFTLIEVILAFALLALGIADYAYVMESGRIVLSGPGKDLLDGGDGADTVWNGSLASGPHLWAGAPCFFAGLHICAASPASFCARDSSAAHTAARRASSCESSDVRKGSSMWGARRRAA